MEQEKIGKFIVELRRKNKMTQSDLADKLFVTRTTVSKWENGNYIPSPEIFWQLSQIFDVTVNELLAGEHYTKENEEEVNRVVVDILNRDSRKIKKIRNIFISTLVLLIVFVIIFFVYYFINNYNSIHVYKISGNGEESYLIDGVIILSKEKAYIKLGEIVLPDDKKISHYKLYFSKDDHQIKISEGTNVNKLLINIFGYDELFSYNDFNAVKENSILEITTNDGEKYMLKLDFKRDFSNRAIIFKKVSKISDEESKNVLTKDNQIPKYIKENFKFDYDSNEYYLNLTIDDKEISKKYSHDMRIYFICEKGQEYTEFYEYSFDDNSISYSKTSDEEVINEFIYSLESNQCVFNSCDEVKIKYVIERYLDDILVES